MYCDGTGRGRDSSRAIGMLMIGLAIAWVVGSCCVIGRIASLKALECENTERKNQILCRTFSMRMTPDSF